MTILMWQGLLANLGIMAVMIGAWTLTFGRMQDLSPAARQAAMAAAGGACVVTLLAFPVEIRPGLIIDLRAVPISLAGFLGGPVVGCTVGVIASLFRLYVGGVGAPPGIIGIAVIMVFGVVAGMLRGKSLPGTGAFLAFAVIAAPLSLAGILFLPSDFRWTFLSQIGAPTAIVNFVGIFVVGVVIAGQLRQLRVAAENELYRSLIDAFPEPLNAKDTAGRFLAANPASARLMRAENAASLIGKTDFDFYPPDVARAFRRDEEAVLASGKQSIIEQHVSHGDGDSVWIATLKVPLRDWRGTTQALLTHNRDISELKRLRDASEVSAKRLDDALTYMADALAVFDADGRLLLCNQQYRAMFPKTAHLRVPGVRIEDFVRSAVEQGEEVLPPGEDIDSWLAKIRESLVRDGDNTIELGDGRTLHARVRLSTTGTSFVVISDITEQRQAARDLAEMNQKLGELARVDGLTGVANRRTFDDMIATEMRRSDRTRMPLSLLMIDLDFFKSYNDRLGHPAGDDCLRQVADVMRVSVGRAGDLVARYGGEEFAVLMPATDGRSAALVAERIREGVQALAIPHPGSPHGVVTLSIGVATSPTGGDPRTLVRDADTALYEAKGAGRNTVCRSLSRAGTVEVVGGSASPSN